MANTYNQEFNHYHIIGIIFPIICLLPFVTLIHHFCRLLHCCHPLGVILFLHFVTCCPSLPSATCCIPSLLTSTTFHHFSFPPHSTTFHFHTFHHFSCDICLSLPLVARCSLSVTICHFSPSVTLSHT